jgi:Putative polyhydroxyalkanoic acid system protein (PHA_gran_rgn)
MQIDVKHELGAEEAIRRLTTYFEELKGRQWPGGVEVAEARTSWNGSRAEFSFYAGKGGFGIDIIGNVEVKENLVALRSELPVLARMFLGEDRIRSTVTRELERVLSAQAPSP